MFRKKISPAAKAGRFVELTAAQTAMVSGGDGGHIIGTGTREGSLIGSGNRDGESTIDSVDKDGGSIIGSGN